MVLHPFKSQHLGGRGRQISEFKASQGNTEKPCLEKKKKIKYKFKTWRGTLVQTIREELDECNGE